jgi:pimeloyl-ACP methyl ester carboxylesterase
VPKEHITQKLICVGKEPDGTRIDMLTVIFGKQNIESKPLLVFLHGYAASAALYYQMYKRLMEYFTVICIDHLGMGASSRPKNYDKHVQPQESIDYFVEYLEKWRVQFSKQMGKELTNIYLVGHSFGAYIAGNYCLKY